MSVYFSGRSLTPYETSHIRGLIDQIWAFLPEIAVGLKSITFFVKPDVNTFSTTKGFKIYLASDYFRLTGPRQKELLVHEYAHAMRQTETGLVLWLAKYFASPWYRLDEELAGLKNEWLYTLRVYRKESFLPDARSIDALARGFSTFYKLWPLSAEYIAGKMEKALAPSRRIRGSLRGF